MAAEANVQPKQTLKAAVLALSVAACLAGTWYSHHVLRTEVVVSHLYYVPIVVAGIWWGFVAVWTALVLGASLLLSHVLSGIPTSCGADLLRATMFIVIAFLVAALWKRLKGTTEELREARDFFTGLVQSSNVPIVVWNGYGMITIFNRAMEELTGFSAGRMVGQPVKALFGPEAYEAVCSVLEAGTPVEAAVRRSDGREAVCLWSPASVRGADGSAATMAQGQDITKRKWAEDLIKHHAAELRALNERLARSEAGLRQTNAAKDRFFSIISHDLRSPFMPLLLNAEVLHKDWANLPPDTIGEMTGALHANARRLYDLVDNLLEWSRLQSGRVECNPSLVGVWEAVNQVFEILGEAARRKGIALVEDVPADLMVWVDRSHLTCVLQNLVSNGVKFTAPAGRVRVSARPVDGSVLIEVTDNGVGMSPRAVEDAFRIDTHHSTLGTAKEKGTGLGLVLCRELLEKNGGAVQVASREGEGSTFTVTLPARQLGGHHT